MARWTASRRKAHSKRIRALRADPAGPYRDHSAKLAQAHADGRHAGSQRPKMTEAQRREHARPAQRRFRAKQTGKRITKDMYPVMLPKTDIGGAWPSVAEAGRRIDALSPCGARQVTYEQIVQGHLWEWYTVGAVEFTPLQAPRRDESIDPPIGAPVSTWSNVHQIRTRALTTFPR
jgi:hypothetical protein